MASVTSGVILSKEKSLHCFHCFHIYLPWDDETGWHDLSSFLSFKPVFFFFLTLLFFIKRLFSFSLLSAIRVVSSAYLGLLMFLPAILILAFVSSRLAFHMMYSAYKLNNQSDNIQPWHTLFPILNQCIVPSPVLNIASWPAYRFLRKQVRWSGIPISLRVFQSVGSTQRFFFFF